ncbi:internal virion protein C [Pseudomonas phage CHF21]|uniref:Internal virion protein C n=1 Tax=Pseudomonas phage CHF21 TaxID=2686375 RepID=A0A7D0TNR7_9CAUD|nr:internal virion protein C [Pseudomonas phage CHF21]
MANDISRAVDQSRFGGTEQLHGSTATTQFQASIQRAPVGSTGLVEAMQQFVKSGSAAFGTYTEQRQKTADERSNEIIRKLTPEQRREAIANGTLLYQDDPYAMNMLRQKSGRSAAYDVEDEIQTKLNNGEFDGKDRKYLEEYRQQRLAQSAKSYAESAGIDENDPEYQAGFNSDIVQRNAGIYDLHARRRSAWFQSQQAVNTRGDLAPLLDDPNVMHSPSGGEVISGYFNNGLQNGSFPSDKQAIDSLSMLVKDVQQKDGGTNLLRSLRDQTINVLGGPKKVADLIDPDIYENAIAQSEANEYKRYQSRTREFELGITTAINQENPETGWRMLQDLRAKNGWLQGSDNMTPQKQKLIDAEQHMIGMVRQQSQATAKETQKAIQGDARVGYLKQQYEARISGQNVSVDPKFQPDIGAGEWKGVDAMTAANEIMADITKSNLPDNVKDAKRAAYLRADYQGGPFQTYYQALITDAQREWNNSVRSGEPGDMTRITELQRAYAADPATIGSVYPEQADFLEKMKDMADSGADPSVLIAAEKATKNMSIDERKFRDQAWADLKNDSSAKDLTSLPGPLERIARTLYDGYNERTGNAKQAQQKVSEWLQKNTVAFTEDQGGTSSSPDQGTLRGRLSKKALMADPADVNSWQGGQSIVEDTLKGLAENPQWADTGMTVEGTDSGDIVISSLNGKRVRITQQQMQLIYKARQAAAAEQKFNEKKESVKTGQLLYNDVIRGGRGPL